MIRPTSRRVIPTRCAEYLFVSRLSSSSSLPPRAKKNARLEVKSQSIDLSSKKSENRDRSIDRSICTAWTDRSSSMNLIAHQSSRLRDTAKTTSRSRVTRPLFPTQNMLTQQLSKISSVRIFASSRVHLSRLHLEVGEASAPGRATPLGARRGRDRAKANSTHA